MNVRRIPRQFSSPAPPQQPDPPSPSVNGGAKVKFSDFHPNSHIPKWMITKEGLIGRKLFEGPRTKLEAREDLSRSIFLQSVILLLIVPLGYSAFTNKDTFIVGYILSIFAFLCLRAIYKRYRTFRDWS